MKITLIGKGKTGSKILDLVPKEDIVKVYHSTTPIELKDLDSADAIIVFIPGPAFEKLIPTLLQTKTPIIIGATGFTWKDADLKSIQSNGLKWIHGHNFSLGMGIVRNILGLINKAESLLKYPNYRVHEIHHTNKLDAPSGTALKWQTWINKENIKITSDRVGDVIGIHELKVDSELENIIIRHEAKDRKLFASGALWAANQVCHNNSINTGLTNFEDLIDQILMKKEKL